MDSSTVLNDTVSGQTGNFASTFLIGCIEVALIVLLFWCYAGQPAPDVNESHYLAKAKHFWNPEWCPNDIFLSSSNPHILFYVLIGWLTLFLPLSTVAMIGRFATWILMAVAWRSLSFSVTGVRLLSVVNASLFLLMLAQCHMAGEWVVGGVEAKGFAFAFVFWALAAIVQGKWPQVWIHFGIASAFHVLVGGWACLAGLAVFLMSKIRAREQHGIDGQSQIARQLIPLIIGGTISLLGVVPPVLANWGVDKETVHFANEILVTQRLSHHQLFDAFSSTRVAMFAALVMTWTLICISMTRSKPAKSKTERLNLFAFSSLVICVCGIFLSGLAKSESDLKSSSIDLLIYYWFRLSDFAVPMAMAFVLTTLAKDHWKSKLGKAVTIIGAVIAISGLAFTCSERWADGRPIAVQRSMTSYPTKPKRTRDTYLNWKLACQWIKENTPTDAVFVTPAKQQTFKWYAHRAEIVNWKDSPQDAEGLTQWYQRVQQLHRPQLWYPKGFWALDQEELTTIFRELGATHVLTSQAQIEAGKVSKELVQIYPKDKSERTTFVVLKFKDP